MDIAGRTALVTGANRGLGRHFAQQLLARGATVYAGARDPGSVDLPGVIPVRLDVTDRLSITAAAEQAQGVSLLINNAGSFTGVSLLDGDRSDIELEMATHYFGPLDVIRAFAPQLAAHETSAVLNVLSVLSWVTFPGYTGYSAAKSAAWSLTNGLRQEMAGQHTQVSALHVGFMDTDMARSVDGPKSDPAVVASLALDGLAAGQLEILADEGTRAVQAGLGRGVTAIYPQFA
ncbi:SDR family oxidoreductase [Blastococcus sp. CT_GayMR16]|uniref:SDR family oxidoreductase n=1 Tax=Blastococcus sp. CT_GayMR16 TaxID=2559607 RepID=UPI001073725D|nr:SDR family oxidoreductase [Blastococcus sp. CT_GayMR16]TFV87167.1 SDR family NAD(P)-dependent oxidoreductase [Blastococcus sp. CT_GayMR16]